MTEFPGYREMETFLRDITPGEIDKRMRRMFSTNPDHMAQTNFKDAAREVMLKVVEEEFGREIRDRVKQEMTVVLDNLAREAWQSHSGIRRSEDLLVDSSEVVRKVTDVESIIHRLEGVYDRLSDVETRAVSASLLSELDQLIDELSRGFENVRRATLDSVRQYVSEILSTTDNQEVTRQLENTTILIDAIERLQ